MYFVNRSDIEKIITYIDKILNQTNINDSFSNLTEQLSLERFAHVLIESILDVGNLMIDGFIMRDPGSYHDIIDILVDERVIPKADEMAYKQLIDLRQQLVKNYTSIDHLHIYKVFNAHKQTFSQFSTHIRSYLTNELGSAHTFSNE